MTLQDFEHHLSGTKTMGHYLVNPELQTCKLFAFDIDVRKPGPGYTPISSSGEPYNPREAWLDPAHEMYEFLLKDVRCMAEGLARRVNNLMGIPVAIADSGGKGYHVYCFTGSIPAEAARTLAHGILEGWRCFELVRGQNFWRHTNPDIYQDLEIETFPKQATVNDGGLGNLMALPLGINRKTGNKKCFISVRSELNKISEMDATRALEGDLPWE